MRFHNTLSGQVEEFVPLKKGRANIYVCGITPYDDCHMGHARTFVAFDMLRRWMMHSDLDVNFIQNVTDIDDKIIKRAKERKMLPLELSAYYDKAGREEMGALGILPATHMPKISEHIAHTIALIEKIIANKHAYATSSGVYFDISSFPPYGKLSRQNLDKIRAGARIEVDEKKRNPEDFALWKIEEAPGATYDSPWGRGRPGWHTECSAMSLWYANKKELEKAKVPPERMFEKPERIHSLDMHGGARDLIFPHHENEIAQSEGAINGPEAVDAPSARRPASAGIKPFSRMWVHTGFLTVNGEKMAKSLGNFVTVKDALAKWDGQTMRLFFALAHYRSPIDFSEAALDAAKNTLDNVRRSLAVMEGEGAQKKDEQAEKGLAGVVGERLGSARAHMDDDLDTPQALADLIEASKAVARARAEGRCSRNSLAWAAKEVADAFAILGIDAAEKTMKAAGMPKDQIEALIAEREAARQKKDFKAADAIRKRLADAGVIIEDSKDGVKYRYA